MNTIDYSKPAPRSDQEAFDIAARHLLTQGRRAEITGPNHLQQCAYRGTDDTKCAIGALILDDVYREEWEGEGVAWLYSNAPAIIPYLPRNRELAVALQKIHDISPVARWSSDLRYAAQVFGLNTHAIDTREG